MEGEEKKSLASHCPLACEVIDRAARSISSCYRSPSEGPGKTLHKVRGAVQ